MYKIDHRINKSLSTTWKESSPVKFIKASTFVRSSPYKHVRGELLRKRYIIRKYSLKKVSSPQKVKKKESNVFHGKGYTKFRFSYMIILILMLIL